MEFPQKNQYLHFLTLFFSIISVSISSSTSSSQHKIPRLSPILQDPEKQYSSSSSSIPSDLKTFYYEQTLDHFNFGPNSNYQSFKQRYVISYKYWGGSKSNSPILAYFGAEAPLDGDLLAVGFLQENAPTFKALQVYIEHRYYGESIPFGKMEEVMKNKSTRAYFNSAQALADYATVLLHIKKNLSAHYSPIIVIGGSYGGMLASWFRLKYPHIAIGALASSAPILYFDDITPQNGYYSIVTKDFKEESESCYETIKESWNLIDEIASKPNGLATLTKRFKICKQLENASTLKNYLETIYATAAQYNSPPNYPVGVVCRGIDGHAEKYDIIGRIFNGMVAYKGNTSCYDTTNYPSQTSIGWAWQTCSEMVMPIGRGSNDTMFQSAPFDLKEFIRDCENRYGVRPRPHWITTYYGGHDIKLVLNKFASNIIFSNGLRDPYSSAGVLEDISDSVVALNTVNGSHCLDIVLAKETDPVWLVSMRNKEIQIIQGWIKNYYTALLKKSNILNTVPMFDDYIALN